MKTLFLILLAGIVLTSSVVQAQLKSGENVRIDEPVNHDLYVAGGTVTVDAPVRGDLIVAGGTIIVNDTVTQDILVAGGNITLNGFVADDIRCGGGKIVLAGNVAGDFVVTGGEIEILKKASVSGNVLSTGGEVIVDGVIAGDLRNASGTFTLNGTTERELESKGGKITINGNVLGNAVLAGESIEVGSEAKFNKDVRYWDRSGAVDFKNSLQGREPIFDSALEIQNGKWHYLGFASFMMVLWYLGTALVMILLVHFLFSAVLSSAANTVKEASLKSLGVGFLFMVGVPIAIVITFITIIGIPLGILSLIAYVTILLLATVIVSLLAANWINNVYYQGSWANGRVVLAAFGIFIFLKLASLTPVVGPLIMLLLACMSFGGILLNVRWKKNKALALT
ncbi:MAG TPA: hypothetical protein VGD40_14750 [Chryseosolibacter sp.]